MIGQQRNRRETDNTTASNYNVSLLLLSLLISDIHPQTKQRRDFIKMALYVDDIELYSGNKTTRPLNEQNESRKHNFQKKTSACIDSFHLDKESLTLANSSLP